MVNLALRSEEFYKQKVCIRLGNAKQSFIVSTIKALWRLFHSTSFVIVSTYTCSIICFVGEYFSSFVQQTTFLSAVHDRQYILYPHIHEYAIQELTN